MCMCIYSIFFVNTKCQSVIFYTTWSPKLHQYTNFLCFPWCFFRSHCFVRRSEVATKYHIKKLRKRTRYLSPPAGLWAMARGTSESSMLQEFKTWGHASQIGQLLYSDLAILYINIPWWSILCISLTTVLYAGSCGKNDSHDTSKVRLCRWWY